MEVKWLRLKVIVGSNLLRTASCDFDPYANKHLAVTVLCQNCDETEVKAILKIAESDREHELIRYTIFKASEFSSTEIIWIDPDCFPYNFMSIIDIWFT